MDSMIAALPAVHLVCYIVVSENSALNQSSTLPVGYVAYPEIGVAYRLSHEIVSWTVAKERCARDNAHLASIDSFLKIQLVMKQKSSTYLTHVGFYLTDGNPDWLSVKTGLPVSSLPWASEQPEGDGKCADIERSTSGLGNYDCNRGGNYVCELPIPENYPLLGNQAGLNMTAN